MNFPKLKKLPKTIEKPKSDQPVFFKLQIDGAFEFVHWRQRLAFLKCIFSGSGLIVGPMRLYLSDDTIVAINHVVIDEVKKHERQKNLGLTIVK